MLVFCSKRLKLHTSIIIKLKDSVQRLLWFQTICNRKCFVKKAHALNSRLQHDKEPYVTICSYYHTNLKISIANDDFWKEAKHFCLDVNTNFCSQFFVGQHFDFCEYTKIYDGLNENEPICVLWLLYGIFRLWRRCTHVSSYTYCTWNQSTYQYFYIMSFKLHLF